MSQKESGSQAEESTSAAETAALEAEEKMLNAKASKLEDEIICIQSVSDARVEMLSAKKIRLEARTERIRLDSAMKPVRFSIVLFVVVFAGLKAFAALGWL